jgi:hypothetical protein
MKTKCTSTVRIASLVLTILAAIPLKVESMERNKLFDYNKMLEENQRVQQNQQIEFVKNVLLWVAAHEQELKAYVPQKTNDKQLTVHNAKAVTKQKMSVGFDDLSDDLVQPIAYFIEYGEDAYALGATNKRSAKLLLHNYKFLAHLTSNRLIEPFNVESTRAFLNVNAEFRDICKGKVTRLKQRKEGIFAAEIENIPDSETQIKMLEALYENANDLIALDTCTKKTHGSNCVIPLIEASIRGNSKLVASLIKKGANVNLVPRKACTSHACDTSANAVLLFTIVTRSDN